MYIKKMISAKQGVKFSLIIVCLATAIFFAIQNVHKIPIFHIQPVSGPSAISLHRSFKPLENAGIYTFYNVCIEHSAQPITRRNQNSPECEFNETKKILVYDESLNSNVNTRIIKTAGSSNTLWNHWDIHFRDEKLLPKKRRVIKDVTAFFIEPTCPGNFHHFFVDEFVTLYSTVALTDRLYSGANNQILYRTICKPNFNTRCTSRERYESFLWTLYIDPFHDVFFNYPAGTCFRQAVFGSKSLLKRNRDIVDHVLRYHNLSQTSNNRNDSKLYVTILERKDRRIINTEELEKFAKSVGFSNVRIVNFDRESVVNQLRIMSTSNVLIGTHGAGLQWAVFMPDKSHLIEIAWPWKHWGFNYKRHVSGFGIYTNGIEVKDVRVNWTSYENNVRNGTPLTAKEKKEKLFIPVRSESDNLWKWADVIVQEKEIRVTLEQIYKTKAN